MDRFTFKDRWRNAKENELHPNSYGSISIEELDDVLAREYFVDVGKRICGKTIIDKGILYNKLTEELGCPLEVAFKKIEELQKENKETDDNYSLSIIEGEWVILKFDRSVFLQPEIQVFDYLHNYQKTWWLKGEKDEKED